MQTFRKFSVFLVTVVILLQPVAAGAAFTVDDEVKLGKEFYDKLAKLDILVQNERVNEYINRLGNAVLSQSSNVLFPFRFSVIKSSAVNAFATPGGYIYVNRGLINLVENESQLAGVLAHEIAHVNSRHIAQQIEKSQKLNFATLAGILAGAFLGGGTGTEATLGLTLAATTSLSLKYSRENEEEADRLGISYLVNAGYDGSSMMSFLKLMKTYEFYSNTLPSYFLTHPGTDERISYLDALVRVRYGKGGAKNILGGLGRVQALLMLEDKDTEAAVRYFNNKLSKNPQDVDSLFGLAVAHMKLGQPAAAFANFSEALRISPDDPDILLELGKAYLASGRTSDAITLLRRSYELDEKNKETLLYLGRAYEEAGSYSTALEFYRKYSSKNPKDVNIFYNMAMAYGKTGNNARSHYYFALYFKNKNKVESALFHLKEAQKYGDPELKAEIEKEIELLRPPKKK